MTQNRASELFILPDFSCAGAHTPGASGLGYKVLADWNGLMISAMAIGVVLERPEWIVHSSPCIRFRVVRRENDRRRWPLLPSTAAVRPLPASGNDDDYCQSLPRPRFHCSRRPATRGFLSQARDWNRRPRSSLLYAAGAGILCAPRDNNRGPDRPVPKRAADSASQRHGTLSGYGPGSPSLPRLKA